MSPSIKMTSLSRLLLSKSVIKIVCVKSDSMLMSQRIRTAWKRNKKMVKMAKTNKTSNKRNHTLKASTKLSFKRPKLANLQVSLSLL